MLNTIKKVTINFSTTCYYKRKILYFEIRYFRRLILKRSIPLHETRIQQLLNFFSTYFFSYIYVYILGLLCLSTLPVAYFLPKSVLTQFFVEPSVNHSVCNTINPVCIRSSTFVPFSFSGSKHRTWPYHISCFLQSRLNYLPGDWFDFLRRHLISYLIQSVYH